ncbi:MAG: exodeoxyribonuclease VII large subunit [Myxococcales bacterium]|nr:exodeoxyribonuclease VII large subunit [Myxococcales bacterium]
MRFRPASATPDALPVGELTRRIKELLEGRFRFLWVEGEISQLKVHQSGHVYFTLKDADARIDAVVWRTTAWRMRYQPGDGERVLARGQIAVWPPRGSYQLVVEEFLPAGQGALQAAFEALKQRLLAEGLFDDARKRDLPWLPRAVGVVTSATGAARRDIEAVIHRRSPQVPIVLYPALVQGEGAAEDVSRGIACLGARPDVDVIIVGRGGGSLEDLWAFNEEIVARAIAACPKPVISAVGHQTDTTIADLVADRRAPTPSAAAEMAVPVRDDLLARIDELCERQHAALMQRVENAGKRVDDLTRRLQTSARFEGHHHRHERLVARLTQAVQNNVRLARQRTQRVQVTLRDQQPSTRLAAEHRRLERTLARLDAAAETQTHRRRADLRELLGRLGALSPLASLARGYSITRAGDRVIRAADEVAVGDEVEVLLHRGRLQARVLTRDTAPAAVLPDQEST